MARPIKKIDLTDAQGWAVANESEDMQMQKDFIDSYAKSLKEISAPKRFRKGAICQYIKKDGEWDGRLYQILGDDGYEYMIKSDQSSRAKFPATHDKLKMFWLQIDDSVLFAEEEYAITNIRWVKHEEAYFVSGRSDHGNTFTHRLHFDATDYEDIELL